MWKKDKQEGAVLILTLIVMVVVSAWAVGVATMANANLQMAENHHKANLALAAAESGLETIRYYLSRIKMPSSTPAPQYFATIVADLNADLNDVPQIVVGNNGSVPDVVLECGQDDSGSRNQCSHPV